MTIDYIQLGALIIGILFVLFGFLVLFSSSFFNWLRKGLWKEEKGKTLFVGLLSKKYGYVIDKYITSIQSILIGIILLAFVFFTLK